MEKCFCQGCSGIFCAFAHIIGTIKVFLRTNSALWEFVRREGGLSSFSQVPIAVVIVADALFLKILQKLDAAFHHYRCSRDIEAGLGRSLEYLIRHPVGRCIADTLKFWYDRNKVFIGMFRYSSLI